MFTGLRRARVSSMLHPVCASQLLWRSPLSQVHARAPHPNGIPTQLELILAIGGQARNGGREIQQQQQNNLFYFFFVSKRGDDSADDIVSLHLARRDVLSSSSLMSNEVLSGAEHSISVSPENATQSRLFATEGHYYQFGELPPQLLPTAT